MHKSKPSPLWAYEAAEYWVNWYRALPSVDPIHKATLLTARRKLAAAKAALSTDFGEARYLKDYFKHQAKAKRSEFYKDTRSHYSTNEDCKNAAYIRYADLEEKAAIYAGHYSRLEMLLDSMKDVLISIGYDIAELTEERRYSAHIEAANIGRMLEEVNKKLKNENAD
jgi:hypothetical protein